MNALPRLLAPVALAERLTEENLRIVDLTPAEHYPSGHIPGAVFLDYADIVRHQPPVMGLLPEPAHLEAVFSRLGIGPDTRVVAYDHEGGGRAARLLWTLQVAGHPLEQLALLDGGIHAWRAEGYPTEVPPVIPPVTSFTYRYDPGPVADREYILAHLDDPHLVLLDARSPAEYAGIDVRAARGGHIPGAVNLDWLELIDRTRDLRLKPEGVLRALLDPHGITPEKTIVAYCQTHHRSALTYWALKVLNYPLVKGYPGSWSDWGNAPDTPVETG